jgi:hypothetical protein
VQIVEAHNFSVEWHCWFGVEIGEMQVNALGYYSQALRNLPSFSAIYAKSSDPNPLELLAIL